MLTLCTNVGTPNFDGPFTYFEILNSGLETFQRFGSLNIAFAALHALDQMINKSNLDTCVIGSGAHTAPAQLMFFVTKISSKCLQTISQPAYQLGCFQFNAMMSTIPTVSVDIRCINLINKIHVHNWERPKISNHVMQKISTSQRRQMHLRVSSAHLQSERSSSIQQLLCYGDSAGFLSFDSLIKYFFDLDPFLSTQHIPVHFS